MQIDDTRLIPPEPPFVRANTPLLCQRALMREIERICSDMRFQDSKGNEDAKLVCYEQYMPLPHKVVDEIEDPRVDTIDFTAAEIEDALQRFPWCKTALVNAAVKEPNGDQIVTFELNVGIYDASLSKVGHRAILNIYDRIYQRFASDPLLESQYYNTGKFSLEFERDTQWPYYYGYIITEFNVAGIQRNGGQLF